MLVDKYKITLDFDLNYDFYEGEEEIFVKLNKNKFVEIDSIDLEIKEVKFNDKKVKYRIEKDKILILNKVKKGKGKISLNFKGQLKEGLGGIYLSSYKINNQKKFLITTQFEPIEARRALPCFDDPSKKAKFYISLIFDKKLEAISNTLPEKIISFDKKKKVIFKETPLMSTYLLYLGIGDWHFKTSKLKDTLIRVGVCQKDKLKGADFAIENTKKFLTYLERYFNFKYPLKKLDLLAIPDFAAGAMENWGAITFRENLLLFFEGKSSKLIKERIAEVIAHELVHMWFGNLVTMRGWDDLWLNESFATYLAYRVVDFYYPDWKILEKYVVSEVVSALNADGLINTHPIKTKIKNPQESLEMFDEISYEKGGSVLRMIEKYIGEENFKKSLRYYIRKFAYKNATSLDLWMSLEKFSNKPISKILKDFIEKPNFPLIDLKKEKDSYLAVQKKFLFLRNKNLKGDWMIPLFVETEEGFKVEVFKEQKMKLKPTKYLNLNKDFWGFYLVDYPLELLKEAIENYSDKLSALDKVFLISCLNFSIKRNKKSLTYLLDLIEILIDKSFNYQKDKLLILYILEILNFYHFYLDNKEIDKLIEKICFKILNQIGWEISSDENLIDTQLRQQSLILLGLISNKKALTFSVKKFRLFIKNNKKITPEIKQPIFINALIANADFLKDFLNLYRRTSLIEDQNRYLIVIGYLRKKDGIKQILDFVLSDEVKFSQSIFALNSLASNKLAVNILFNWLVKNWDKLEEKAGGKGKGDFILMKIIKIVIPQIGPFVDNKNLKKFLSLSSLKNFYKTVKIVLEKTQIIKKMMAHQQKFIK